MRNYFVILIVVLGSCPHTGQLRSAGLVESEEPEERWEDASSFAPVLNRPTLSATKPTSSSGYETAETSWPGSTSGYTPTSARDIGQPRLPWGRKESGYVIGSGELGLLNELQIPRRGAAVPLARDFLRVPSQSVASSGDSGMFEPPPPAMEPLVPLIDEDRLTGSGERLSERPDYRLSEQSGDRTSEQADGRLGSPSRLFSPILPSARGSVVWKRHIQMDTADSTLDDRQPRSALRPVGVTGGLPLTPDEHPAVGSAGDNFEMQVRGGGEVNDRVDGSADEYKRKPHSSRGQVTRIPRCLGGEPSVEAGAGARPPPGRGGSGWVGDLASPAHVVETASAAERIAAFRPGTRFRVAVDKGLTGLGITIKEIRGRFFVYRLQTLADGSPGAAEVSEMLTFAGTLLHDGCPRLACPVRLMLCVFVVSCFCMV